MDFLRNISFVDADARVAQLCGGYVNDMYLVSTQDKQYVLRINKNINNDCVSLSMQFNVMTVTGNEKIGPSVVYSNDDKTMLLMEYFEGINLMANNLTPTLIHKIMNSLKKLHSIKNINISYNPFEHIRKMTSSIKYNKKEDLDIINDIEKKLEINKDKYFGFCHNDLHNGNILVSSDENIAIIDYDYCGFYDIIYDIVSLHQSLDLGNSEIDIFIKSYFGVMTKDTYLEILDRFSLFSIVYHFWNAIWYIYNNFEDLGRTSMEKFYILTKKRICE